MKLHEIANDYMQAMESDDKYIPDLLDQIKAPLESKAMNVAKYITNLRSSRNAIDDEIARLTKLGNSLQKREQSIIDYLDYNMSRCGIEKIESPLFSIKYKLCPCHVKIDDENNVPDEYKKIKTEVVIDKVKLKEELKAGVIIPGATLVKNKKLEIK